MTQAYFNENQARGLPGSAPFQVGVDHKADTKAPEALATIPTLTPDSTYINYGCHIECFLDTGMALHKTLPQQAQPVDTLGTYDVSQSGGADVITGENLKSRGTYKDIIQRVSTSTYRFLLKGFGVRVGYPVPVPSLKTVCGIPATPERQWVHGNEVVGNYSGVPVFRNAWELWYIVAGPPQGSQLPPPNLAEHIAADQVLPDSIQVAVSPNDYNAVQNVPNIIPPKTGSGV
jgi:hypothetical protein